MESSPDISLAAEHQTYDPQFTADISSRMRVPDHIGMSENRPIKEEKPEPPLNPEQVMKVPERIIVAGDDNHIEAKRAPPMSFSTDEYVPHPNIPMATPPRVITVREQEYPSVDVADDEEARSSDGLTSPSLDMDDTYVYSSFPEKGREPSRPGPDGDEGDLYNTTATFDEQRTERGVMEERQLRELWREMQRLSRRVKHLETVNDSRAARDRLILPVVILYGMFKLGSWLFSRQ